MITKKTTIFMSSPYEKQWEAYKKQLKNYGEIMKKPKTVKPIIPDYNREKFVFFCKRSLTYYEIPIKEISYEKFKDIVEIKKN